MSANLHLVLLGLSWLGYGLIHSLLASNSLKRLFRKHFPAGYRGYRLGYNLLALALLIVPLWLLVSYPANPLWRYPPTLGRLLDVLALVAVAGFIWSARYYDTAEFAGIRQLQRHETELNDEAPLRLSPLHRWVRHPWYFLGLVILWSREMNAALLVSAIMLTLYLVAGSRLEDDKLISCYGEPYRRYRDKVPGLLPVPWRHLSRQDAAAILADKTNKSARS